MFYLIAFLLQVVTTLMNVAQAKAFAAACCGFTTGVMCCLFLRWLGSRR